MLSLSSAGEPALCLRNYGWSAQATPGRFTSDGVLPAARCSGVSSVQEFPCTVIGLARSLSRGFRDTENCSRLDVATCQDRFRDTQTLAALVHGDLCLTGHQQRPPSARQKQRLRQRQQPKGKCAAKETRQPHPESLTLPSHTQMGDAGTQIESSSPSLLHKQALLLPLELPSQHRDAQAYRESSTLARIRLHRSYPGRGLRHPTSILASICLFVPDRRR